MSRFEASTVVFTSKPSIRRTAVTSSASLRGLGNEIFPTLYLLFPTTSATRRSAQASTLPPITTKATVAAIATSESSLFIMARLRRREHNALKSHLLGEQYL